MRTSVRREYLPVCVGLLPQSEALPGAHECREYLLVYTGLLSQSEVLPGAHECEMRVPTGVHGASVAVGGAPRCTRVDASTYRCTRAWERVRTRQGSDGVSPRQTRGRGGSVRKVVRSRSGPVDGGWWATPSSVREGVTRDNRRSVPGRNNPLCPVKPREQNGGRRNLSEPEWDAPRLVVPGPRRGPLGDGTVGLGVRRVSRSGSWTGSGHLCPTAVVTMTGLCLCFRGIGRCIPETQGPRGAPCL